MRRVIPGSNRLCNLDNSLQFHQIFFQRHRICTGRFLLKMKIDICRSHKLCTLQRSRRTLCLCRNICIRHCLQSFRPDIDRWCKQSIRQICLQILFQPGKPYIPHVPRCLIPGSDRPGSLHSCLLLPILSTNSARAAGYAVAGSLSWNLPVSQSEQPDALELAAYFLEYIHRIGDHHLYLILDTAPLDIAGTQSCCLHTLRHCKLWHYYGLLMLLQLLTMQGISYVVRLLFCFFACFVLFCFVFDQIRWGERLFSFLFFFLFHHTGYAYQALNQVYPILFSKFFEIFLSLISFSSRTCTCMQ